jgi:hypothetical protein
MFKKTFLISRDQGLKQFFRETPETIKNLFKNLALNRGTGELG